MNSSSNLATDGGQSIHLTDDSVSQGRVRDYKVVIVTIRQAEGYTLTRLKVMVTSVYPSNQATRVQIEGRINRIGQVGYPHVVEGEEKRAIKYVTVHCGALTWILENHRDAKSIEDVMRQLADEIDTSAL